MNFQDFEAADFACDESFQRYCLEENDSDILFWESWITRHPEKKAAVLEARYMIEVLSARQGNRLEQLKHLKDGISQYDLLHSALEEPSRQNTPAPARKTGSLFKYAAALGGILLLAGAIYLFSRNNTVTDISSPKTSMVVINAGNDPRKTVVLPDGSSIILRKNSTVELAAGFNEVNRKLTLTGEAFFDVTQHAQYPFIVHTAAFDIKVLGTVFNVSAYAGSHQSETALFKGKVEVTLANKPEEKIILQPNQKLTMNVTGLPAPVNPFKVMPLDADPVNHKAREIAWVRNRLEIENEPLEVIAGKLEKWYGIRVTFADEEVKHYRYSGTFESETILKALDALQLSYPFSFKMVNGQIIISK
ncbi:FecR family protein [Chitinophaga sp. RCC_12]|uniref:FecR family protein n=1 Tax=Chitinophaga sp. RCC_12 TaxID=3239226 RepID=UPI003524D01E